MQNYKLLREYKNISVKKCSNASASYHKQKYNKASAGCFYTSLVCLCRLDTTYNNPFLIKIFKQINKKPYLCKKHKKQSK